MLTALRRRRDERRAERPDDAGVTLVELLVTFGLLSIIGVIAMNFFVQSTKYSGATTDGSLTTADGRVALSTMANLIRLADTPSNQAGYPTARFETVAANKMVFYSNVNTRSGSASRGAPTKVVLFASSGQLTEQLFAPKVATPTDYTTNYPTTPTSSRVLLNHLHSTSLFSYCSADIDPSTAACTSTSVGTKVASVAISFVLDGLPGEQSQTFSTKVGITGALAP